MDVKSLRMAIKRCRNLVLLSGVYSLPIHDVFGKEEKGYTPLRPDCCVTLESDSVKKLPGRWQKYGEFVKRCVVGHGDSKTNPSLVSIWILDYYDANLPTSAPREWEDFPLPLIMDHDFKPIGELPEHYPDDPPRELEILYNKKNSTGPPDIKVQVYNPAVSGNYVYPLIKWNEKRKQYEMNRR